MNNKNLKEHISRRQEYNKEILNILSKLVNQYPDQRFGQIICNYVFPNYRDEDPFYTESNVTLEQLKKGNQYEDYELYNTMEIFNITFTIDDYITEHVRKDKSGKYDLKKFRKIKSIYALEPELLADYLEVAKKWRDTNVDRNCKDWSKIKTPDNLVLVNITDGTYESFNGKRLGDVIKSVADKCNQGVDVMHTPAWVLTEKNRDDSFDLCITVCPHPYPESDNGDYPKIDPMTEYVIRVGDMTGYNGDDNITEYMNKHTSSLFDFMHPDDLLP